MTATAKTQRIPPGRLVEDFTLYPRHHRDPQHVRDVAEAYRAGAHLPPVRVTEDLRLTDGWHRKAAWQQVFGEEPMEVEVHTYGSNAEAFLDAIELNSRHGRKLDRRDMVRVVEHGSALELSPDRLAAALQVRTETVTKLGTRVAWAGQGQRVTLKAATAHLAGRTLSDDQVEGNERAGGLSLLFHINQVRNAVQRDLVDWENERHVRELCGLRDLLVTELDGRCP